ncbi:MAG: tRNA dihydrouridine synthase DusB [Syntrophomonadaceae bacterium]
MFKIGSMLFPNRVIAAPMAGISDRSFRHIARLFGCGLVYSEMVSAKGLVYGQEKSLFLTESGDFPGPVNVQIFGSDPQIMAQAAVLLAKKPGVDLIDINMGCPTPKIVKNGEGAALLLNLPLCRSIIRHVVAAASIPVTVKMRRGWEEASDTCLELAKIAEEEGAQAITLHPRSRMQFFSGKADWNLIREVKERVAIPVIGNGDIWTAEDAASMLKATGCDAVMIGRGSLGNPFLFRETVSLVEKGMLIDPPCLEEKIETALRHMEMLCALKGEYTGVREMRKHIAWYVRGLPGAARLRVMINQAVKVYEIKTILNSIRENE